MDKTETRDLGIQDINTENKKTLWLIVAIIAVIVIIVLVISFYISLSASAPKGPKESPTQKNVNLLDEKIESKPENAVSMKPLTAECYENSWQTANGENFRQAAKLANVKWYNTESASAIPSDVRGMSFIKEGFKGNLNPQYGLTPSSTVSDSGVAQTSYMNVKPVDFVSKAASANTKASAEVTAVIRETNPSSVPGASKASGEASAGAKAVRASMPPGYKYNDVATKGGLLETSTPIPVVVVDRKEIPVPGITGLDYYDHFASTALTGGSVDRYAKNQSNTNQSGKQYPLTGSYNSKSYYADTVAHKKEVAQNISFGNTPVADTVTVTGVPYKKEVAQNISFGNTLVADTVTATGVPYKKGVAQDISFRNTPVGYADTVTGVPYKKGVAQDISFGNTLVADTVTVTGVPYKKEVAQNISFGNTLVADTVTATGVPYKKGVAQDISFRNTPVGYADTVTGVPYKKGVAQDISFRNTLVADTVTVTGVPYKKEVARNISFGNTPVSYADTVASGCNPNGNGGKGTVTNEDYERIAEACKSRGLTGNTLQECQTDSGMAGVNTAYSRNDLVGAYRGYEDSFLLADGVDVGGSFADKLIASATIVETAEIEYKEEVKKNASISVMNNSDVCDPLVIYKQFIGLVDENDDDTTPENHRVVQ